MGQSFKGLWRNGVMTLASITVLISCLIVIGSFALLTLNINVNLEKIGLMNEIVVFVDESKTEEEVSAIGEQIRALDNVSEVKFISKDEALAEEKEKYSEYSALYELVDGDNPLRDSFVITYEDSNGNTKERVFEATVEAMAYEPADPGMDDPSMIDPEPASTFPWKYVIIAVVAALIVLLIVLRIRKKKAKQKAEQAL